MQFACISKFLSVLVATPTSTNEPEAMEQTTVESTFFSATQLKNFIKNYFSAVDDDSLCVVKEEPGEYF